MSESPDSKDKPKATPSHHNPAPEERGLASEPAERLRPSTADATELTSAEPQKGESILWAGRTHWKHFMGSIGGWFLGSVLYAILGLWLLGKTQWSGGVEFIIVAGPIVVVGIGVFLRVWISILGCRYRLSDERIFIERGILSQTIDQTELIRIDDVRLSKSLADRLMGLGTIELISTDPSDPSILIEGIADSERVAETVRTHMRRLRKKSLYVESL